jgi:hypothetical protein
MPPSLKKRYTPEEKQSFISGWQKSGQTKIAFAQSNGLVYDTFLGWIQKEAPIQKPVFKAPSNPDPSFVAIQVEHTGYTAKPGIPLMEITLANGSHISFYQTVPMEYLRDLLK